MIAVLRSSLPPRNKSSGKRQAEQKCQTDKIGLRNMRVQAQQISTIETQTYDAAEGCVLEKGNKEGGRFESCESCLKLSGDRQ